MLLHVRNLGILRHLNELRLKPKISKNIESLVKEKIESMISWDRI